MPLEDLVRDFNTGGLGSTWSAGQKYAADRESTLANTAQRQAETQRYTGETPTYLDQKRAELEKSRLGNLQGQAMESAGVYGQEAEAAKYKKMMEAKQAKQLWDNADPELKAKAQTEAHKLSQDLITIGLEGYNSTGKIVGAFNAQAQFIQANAHRMPEGEAQRMLAEVEKGLVKADQMYGRNPQAWYAKALQQAKEMANIKMASDPTQQGKLGAQAAQDAAAMERTKYTADAGIREADIRASAPTGETKENTTMAIRRLAGIIASPTASEAEKTAAEYELQAQLKFGQQTESSGIDPMFDVNKAKTLPPRPSGAAPAPVPNIAAWVKAARVKNPNATDAELTAYYKNKYGGK